MALLLRRLGGDVLAGAMAAEDGVFKPQQQTEQSSMHIAELSKQSSMWRVKSQGIADGLLDKYVVYRQNETILLRTILYLSAVTTLSKYSHQRS